METPNHWLFRAPKTSEQKLSEIEQVAEFVEWVVWRPVLMLVRWPWWPLYLDVLDKPHGFWRFSTEGRFAFLLLCLLAFAAEVVIVLTVVLKPLISLSFVIQDATIAAWAGVAFAACTLTRIIVYLYDEHWNT